MDVKRETNTESHLNRLFGRFAQFAEAMETQPIDMLARQVADIERRVARIEHRLASAARDAAKEN